MLTISEYIFIKFHISHKKIELKHRFGSSFHANVSMRSIYSWHEVWWQSCGNNCPLEKKQSLPSEVCLHFLIGIKLSRLLNFHPLRNGVPSQRDRNYGKSSTNKLWWWMRMNLEWAEEILEDLKRTCTLYFSQGIAKEENFGECVWRFS